MQDGEAYSSDNSADSLEKILKNKSLVRSGQIKLLGLDKLKEKLGYRWPRLLGKVHSYLVSIIQKYLSGKDVYFNKSDEEFIIVFSSADEEVAKLISAKILEELSQKFLGTVDMENIIVKTAIQDIDGDTLFMQNDLKGLLEQYKKDKKKEKHPHSPKTQSNNYDCTLMYNPIWNVKKEAITTFAVSVTNYIDTEIQKGVVPKKFGYEVIGTSISKEDKADLDQVVLSRCISTIKKLHENKIHSIINIPLCYEAVYTTDLLVQYAAICEEIPNPLKKYINFTLTNPPKGIATPKLEFIIATLKNYCSTVMMISPISKLNFENYKETGIDLIGIILPKQSEKHDKIWHKLEPVIKKCHEAKLKVGLYNVNSLKSLKNAKASEVDFISGTIIGDHKNSPGHMKRLTWKDLLSKP